MVRLASIALGIVLVVAQASAQSAEDDRAAAQALFEEGVELGGAHRWAEALAAFRRSAALVPRASTSYNIANALYRLDRPAEGLAELDAYARMPEVLGDKAARQRGATLRKLLEAAVVEARLLIAPAEAQVFVDGRPVPILGPERHLLLNPGAHTLRVTHDGHAPHQREIEVKRGSVVELSVALEPLPVVPESLPVSAGEGSASIAVGLSEIDLTSSEAPRDERKPFVKRPGFWWMIGTIAAAGIAAGVAIAVTRNDDAPSCGTTGTCATTQGLTVASF